jgi:hypothetical protein
MTPRQAQRHGKRGSRGSQLLLALALVGAPALTGVAWAAPPAPAAGQARTTEQQRLTDECARLRAALERAQADIASLKQGDRGVRDDYRLRRRMADAEQLARQLTAAEGDLRRLDAGARPTVPASPAVTGPAEAPGVLQARADLLSDQARRLAQQAASYQRTATQLRARQTLRRRAGQMERDPFGAMDGSKRFMVVRGQESTDTRTSTTGGSKENGFTNPQPTNSPTPPPVGQPGATAVGPPTSTDNTRGGGPSTTTPVTPPPPPTSARALLDPALAAELSKLEASGGAGLGDVDKLERAAAALQHRAQGLEAQAQALRARAAKHSRARSGAVFVAALTGFSTQAV